MMYRPYNSSHNKMCGQQIRTEKKRDVMYDCVAIMLYKKNTLYSQLSTLYIYFHYNL